MPRRITWVSVVFGILGVVLLVVGVIYLTITAPHLPVFMPGRAPNARPARHYNKRGILALVLAAISLVIAYVASRGPKPATAATTGTESSEPEPTDTES